MDLTLLLCHTPALLQHYCKLERNCFTDNVCCHSKAAASIVQLLQMMPCFRNWLTRQHFGSREISLGLIFPLCMLLLWKDTSVRYILSHDGVCASSHVHPRSKNVCGFRAADFLDSEVPEVL